MLEALLFDFDGLMVETEWSSYVAWADLFAEHGAELTLDDFRVCIGTRNAIDFGELLASKTGKDGPSDAELRAIKQPRQDRAVAALPLQPGVAELIAAAKADGIAIAVASSSERDWIEPHLERHDLTPHVDVLATWEGAHVGYPPKPAPDIYLRALDALGVAPSRGVAFEDSFNGLTAAKDAGLWCVAVPNELTRVFDFSRADLVVESLLHVDLEVARGIVRSAQ